MYNEYSLRLVRDFMARVYLWMGTALGISAGVAYWAYSTPAVFNAIFGNSAVLWPLLLVQVGLVVVLSALLHQMSYPVALGVYLLYAALTGLVLSSIFAVYAMSSIYVTFIVAALMFATMAIYGYVTNADLTRVGSFALMGLFGVIIGSLVNFFFHSPAVDYLLSMVGVIVFTLLTAYDVQRLRHLGMQLSGQGHDLNKVALMGALKLYLDFINLFLYLLRILGRRKD